MHHETTTHDRLQAALDLAGLEPSASEIHGLVCGEICRELRLGRGSDLPELIGSSRQPRGAERAALGIVEELMESSFRALDAGQEFELLLPGDDESIADRTASLADWARGFALALLRGDGLKLEHLKSDSAEVVRDLLKISEARPGEEDEEDERALAELEEYLRVGVQLVFEELQPDSPERSDESVH